MTEQIDATRFRTVQTANSELNKQQMTALDRIEATESLDFAENQILLTRVPLGDRISTASRPFK